MRVVRLKPYLRAMKAMGMGEGGMNELETFILSAPDAHPIIPGLKGARKARFARPGKGKRGGGRAIYYLAVTPQLVFMMTAYPKNERDDLSPEQRRMILEAIESIRAWK
ncbi:MAG: type II toxin-antitoxin system RelE/ParE family toxin [Methyloceanibacter sp.]